MRLTLEMLGVCVLVALCVNAERNERKIAEIEDRAELHTLYIESNFTRYDKVINDQIFNYAGE